MYIRELMESFSEGQELIRLQCLPLPKERKSERRNNLQTYCVKLKNIDGLSETTASDSYQLQAVLFDEKHRTFIGSFWNGKPVEVKNRKIVINQSFYFYTSIPGDELLLIIEVITPSKIHNTYKSAGWLYMPLIGADKAGPNASNSLQYKVPLLCGTPLALLIVEDGIKGISSTQHTAGLEISLSLSRHPELLQLIHLVPENVVFDASYIIPGLIPESPDVIKDSEYLFKPHLQKCITLTLEKVCIRVQPSLQDAEFKIIEKIREHLDSELNKSSKATIAQRRLQVAVYNGYRFIHEPDYYHLIVEPLVSSAVDNTAKPLREEVLILRSDIKLPNVPDDPDIAVVFLIEYIVSYPGSNVKETSVISSASKAPMSNFGICWGFTTLRSLRENSSENIILTCNPASYPHKILFVKLANKFEMSFVTFSLSKQNKKSMLPVPSAVERQSVGSASVQEPQSVEASVMYSPSINHPAQNYKPTINSLGQPFHSTSVFTEKGKTNVNRAFHSTLEYVEKGRTSLEFQENANNMALQEVTIVPSSLPLIPPLLHLFPVDSGLSSNTFTKLYWDKLQPVSDHHGKPAVQIDNSVPYSIDRDLELHSPPQKNEYMFQLLAISGLEEYSQLPSEIFFTFQFYRFLSVRSESLLLKPLSEDVNNDFPKSSVVYAFHTSRSPKQSLGFQVTYHIDPSELDSGEYKAFLHYIMKQSLHIDLWNGQSLLYFGTVTLPLKYFCRQGKEAVFTILELDIINCEFSDDSLNQAAVPMQSSKGKLHLRVASIRHPLSANALEKYAENINKECVIVNSNKDAPPMNFTVFKARPIIETSKELSNLLASRCVLNNSNASEDSHLSEEKRRKLARMQAVKNLENEDKSSDSMNEGMQHFFRERQRDLLSIESYIQKNKSELIQSLLHTSVTYEKVIYPVIGNKSFFEFELENPFKDPRKVTISWRCSELSLVVDSTLWQILRNMHNISQKVDFLSYGDSNQQIPSILLQPREKVYVPFTYQCLTAQPSQVDLFKATSGHHFSSDMLASVPVSNSLETRYVKIRFVTEDQTLLALLNLKIQPLPPSFTHVFKFLSMEHSVFKKSIRINTDSTVGTKTIVLSSDSEVSCSIQESQDWEGDVDVHLKAPTKASGKCREFYIFIYKDKYQIVSVQTWIVSICPLQRIDLSCIAGQLMRSSLLIRGTHATNLVKCFSNSDELQLHPSEPFVLSPFAVQELSMNIRSLLPGIKHFQITMVNQALEQVLQSWLLVLSCQKPFISKAFQVHLSVGKEATKRITYTNSYHQSRSFVLHSSHPHLLRLKEYLFTVPAGKNYYIGLYFPPQDFVFTETLFLYLNDSEDKNEETYCIKVICQ